jgi:hygromycin-B 7''-O-kinase
VSGTEAGRVRLWEVPFPELSDEAMAEVVRRHGLDVGVRPERLPSRGVVNSIWAIGDVVLRLPKDHPDALADTWTESVAAPAAHRTGIRTPQLVVFDNTCDLVPVPFTIFQRVAGAGLSRLNGPDLWRDLGHDLAVVHATATADDPDGHLDVPGRDPDFVGLLKVLVDRGDLNLDNAAELTRWLTPLHGALSDHRIPRVFVHNDIQPANVMADHARYTAIIDWGDAGYADPAIDFRYLPLRALPFVIAGYRNAGCAALDEAAIHRIWYDQIFGALIGIRRGPLPSAAAWGRPTATRLFELAAAINDGLTIGQL